MATRNDPAAATAPDGSFFNFATLNPLYSGCGASPYYSGVVLECSPLFTEANVQKVERAVSRLRAVFAEAGASGASLRIDGVIAEFQSHLGETLLGELRKGIRYVNRTCMNRTSTLRTVYTRGLAMRIFAPQISKGVESLRHSAAYAHPVAKVRSEAVTRRRMRWMNASHYASYLSTAAAWMLRRDSGLDPGTIHSLSLMMARARKDKDDARDMRRINEAVAVIAAETVRSKGFLEMLSCEDGAREQDQLPFAAFSMAVQGKRVVSIRAPFLEIQAARNVGSAKISVADVVQLCVDNRIVEAPEQAEAPDVAGRRLVPYSGGSPSSSYEIVRQTRTGLLPGAALKLVLDHAVGTGIPLLVARSESGTPEILAPADGRCMAFLAKMYGVKTPDPLVPASRETSMAWAVSTDGEMFVDMLRQRRKVPYVTCWGEFANEGLTTTRAEFVGERDLSDYLPGGGKSGLTVSEIMLY